MVGTIFVAGTYGVGKSTLCRELSKVLQIPEYSAGDIISSVNGETYQVDKFVKDKNSNQSILVATIKLLLERSPNILLAGHFCIFDKEENIDYLPRDVFSELRIDMIILLEAQVSTIIENLFNRDGKHYSEKNLLALQQAERKTANEIAKRIQCNIYVHSMRFDKTDVEIILRRIKSCGLY